MPNKGVATDGIGFVKPDGNFEYVDAANPLPVTFGSETVTVNVGPSVEISNDAGNPIPVDITGELLEAVEALRMAVQSLAKSGMGVAMPDTTGRLRVLAALDAAQTLGAVTTVGTVNTVTNQSQVGTIAANDQVPALMRMSAGVLRGNIIVT